MNDSVFLDDEVVSSSGEPTLAAGTEQQVVTLSTLSSQLEHIDFLLSAVLCVSLVRLVFLFVNRARSFGKHTGV